MEKLREYEVEGRTSFIGGPGPGTEPIWAGNKTRGTACKILRDIRDGKTEDVGGNRSAQSVTCSARAFMKRTGERGAG